VKEYKNEITLIQNSFQIFKNDLKKEEEAKSLRLNKMTSNIQKFGVLMTTLSNVFNTSFDKLKHQVDNVKQNILRFGEFNDQVGNKISNITNKLSKLKEEYHNSMNNLEQEMNITETHHYQHIKNLENKVDEFFREANAIQNTSFTTKKFDLNLQNEINTFVHSITNSSFWKQRYNNGKQHITTVHNTKSFKNCLLLLQPYFKMTKIPSNYHILTLDILILSGIFLFCFAMWKILSWICRSIRHSDKNINNTSDQHINNDNDIDDNNTVDDINYHKDNDHKDINDNHNNAIDYFQNMNKLHVRSGSTQSDVGNVEPRSSSAHGKNKNDNNVNLNANKSDGNKKLSKAVSLPAIPKKNKSKNKKKKNKQNK